MVPLETRRQRYSRNTFRYLPCTSPQPNHTPVPWLGFDLLLSSLPPPLPPQLNHPQTGPVPADLRTAASPRRGDVSCTVRLSTQVLSRTTYWQSLSLSLPPPQLPPPQPPPHLSFPSSSSTPNAGHPVFCDQNNVKDFFFADLNRPLTQFIVGNIKLTA
jgi:hypothetical protein